MLKNEPEKKKIKRNIFGGNDNKFETFIHRPKDVKDNAMNIEIVEYEYEDGKWRTVFKNARNSNAVEQSGEVPEEVPEKVKQ